jgi:hypothetical protein
LSPQYKSPDVVEQIQNATGNSLKLAFDTISEGNTQSICVKSLAPASEGVPGKVLVVLLPNKEAKELRKDVVIQREPKHEFLKVSVLNNYILTADTLLYTALGRSLNWSSVHFPASSEDRNHMASWMPKLEALVNSGQLKPNPVKLWPGGLEAVHEGFQFMREGKVSAEKIVYNVE